jgi:hypothetical protein
LDEIQNKTMGSHFHVMACHTVSNYNSTRVEGHLKIICIGNDVILVKTWF